MEKVAKNKAKSTTDMQMSAYANEPAITSLNDAAEFVGKRKKRRLAR